MPAAGRTQFDVTAGNDSRTESVLSERFVTVQIKREKYLMGLQTAGFYVEAQCC